MSIADELKKLSELHTSGALTDTEFEQAKKALLSDGPRAVTGPPRDRLPHSDGFRRSDADKPDESLGRAANRYVSFQIVMAVIGIILFIVFFFGVIQPGMHRGPSVFPSGGPVRLP